MFRADASTAVGIGHVARSLALAEAWRAAGGAATFVGAWAGATLREEITARGFEALPLERTHPDRGDLATVLARLDGLRADGAGSAWAVVDGYQFDAGYHAAVRAAGHRLLVIDDQAHLARYHADILLNQNAHAPGARYATDDDTRRLLGPRYALLRPEFAARRARRPMPAVARRVLVTLGGGDPANVTLEVIRAIQLLPEYALEARVVVGPANPHGDALRRAIAEGGGDVELVTTTTAMAELMAWADVAVSAAGSTCWELACLGVPAVVIVTADNQRPVADALHAAGVVRSLGGDETLSSADLAKALAALLPEPELRAAMAARGRALVDGDGAGRVVMHMTGEPMRVRRAREDDCRLLWELANEPGMRAAAFSTDPIPWDTHVGWFEARLRSPRCHLFVGVDADDTPVGYARCDVGERDEAEISVTVDHRRRGRGEGRRLIALATRALFRTTAVPAVHAFIKPANAASLRAFAEAGYRPVGDAVVRGHDARHYVKRRDDDDSRP